MGMVGGPKGKESEPRKPETEPGRHRVSSPVGVTKATTGVPCALQGYFLWMTNCPPSLLERKARVSRAQGTGWPATGGDSGGESPRPGEQQAHLFNVRFY